MLQPRLLRQLPQLLCVRRAGLTLLAALATAAVLPLAAADAPKPAPATTAPTELAVTGLAMLREWQPPTYPEQELKAKHSGMVNVRFVVDEKGRVTSAHAIDDPDAEFVDAALAAVKSWVFAPGLDAGKPVANCLDTLVMFSPAVGQERSTPLNMPPATQKFSPAPHTPPTPVVTPDGGYPDVLSQRKLSGIVYFVCTVSPAGRAIQSQIMAASHADFVLPALEALTRWEFTPGAWGDLPESGPVEGRMSFDSIGGNLDEIYAANGLSAPDGSPAPVTPQPAVVVDPVWPLDRLLAGESGSATVEFTIGNTGKIRDVHVREASKPEFGEALAAAVEAGAFQRPMVNSSGAPIVIAKHHEFGAVPPDASAESTPVARLVLALREGKVSSAKGLDEKLLPLYRVSPTYPAALVAAGRPKGRAEIEFVIDREGRARFPRIVSATHPEFGWAAATAIAQWVFKAPRRAGEPTDVKVMIPVEFTPPAPSA